jgi:eukaryotic-like serine/threonine-protein kinase
MRERREAEGRDHTEQTEKRRRTERTSVTHLVRLRTTFWPLYSNTLALTPGMRLGQYEILSALGAGGMSEVYRARDTRLDRDVAIKILPETFAADAERLARFQREAKVLASLNHPNIAMIHGLEHAEGVHAIVMELVEGEDLARRIARGAIPLAEALAIANQIAQALEMAHEKGIVHRDLKPANVALTATGQVKVLDFGLAKASDQSRGSGLLAAVDLTQSPTIASPGMMSGVGIILGTAAYMAPEQARGQAADKRADIWAFGCLFFEMLTGREAFTGETVTDIVAAVMKSEPDWSRLRSDTPPPIRSLLRRCLQKDPTRRLRDAGDAAIEIQERMADPGLGSYAVAGTRQKAPWVGALPWV